MLVTNYNLDLKTYLYVYVYVLFNYIQMGTPDEAANAIDKLNGAQLNEATLEVKYANQDVGQKSQTEVTSGVSNDNLYIRNLPSTYSDGKQP